MARDGGHYKRIATSSNRDDWYTPLSLVRKVEARWGKFDLDVAAMRDTAVVPNYLGPDHLIASRRDALRCRWHGRCWCNPPFGRGVTEQWVRMAWHQAWKGYATTIMLIPNRIGADWFYRYGLRADELVILVGRINFDDSEDSAPFDCLLLVFNAREQLPDGSLPPWDTTKLPTLTTMHVPAEAGRIRGLRE